MTPREEIGYGLDALVIFRSLQQDPVIRALMQFCHTDKENTPAQIRFYSAMVSALYERADDLTGYLEQIVLEHENVYVQRAGAGEPISPNLETCLHTELKLQTDSRGCQRNRYGTGSFCQSLRQQGECLSDQ